MMLNIEEFGTDSERIWDLEPSDYLIRRCEEHWGANGDDQGLVGISFYQTKRGWFAKMVRHFVDGSVRDIHISHGMISGLPLWQYRITSQEEWDLYVAPYLSSNTMIDMEGELDGDDIELAQIIMDEIEEERNGLQK